MNLTKMAPLMLCLAAFFEVGGDALIRVGLRESRWGLAAGAIVLFLYGLTVNSPAWDFNRLMAAYGATFVVVSQVLSFLIFNERPTPSLLAGLGFVLIGCGIIQWGKLGA